MKISTLLPLAVLTLSASQLRAQGEETAANWKRTVLSATEEIRNSSDQTSRKVQSTILKAESLLSAFGATSCAADKAQPQRKGLIPGLIELYTASADSIEKTQSDIKNIIDRVDSAQRLQRSSCPGGSYSNLYTYIYCTSQAGRVAINLNRQIALSDILYNKRKIVAIGSHFSECVSYGDSISPDDFSKGSKYIIDVLGIIDDYVSKYISDTDRIERVLANP